VFSEYGVRVNKLVISSVILLKYVINISGLMAFRKLTMQNIIPLLSMTRDFFVYHFALFIIVATL
jgi:hypothetical protein